MTKSTFHDLVQEIVQNHNNTRMFNKAEIETSYNVTDKEWEGVSIKTEYEGCHSLLSSLRKRGLIVTQIHSREEKEGLLIYVDKLERITNYRKIED